MSEILTSVKLLKFYNWEERFARAVAEVRLLNVLSIQQNSTFNRGTASYYLCCVSHEKDTSPPFTTFLSLMVCCMYFV